MSGTRSRGSRPATVGWPGRPKARGTAGVARRASPGWAPAGATIDVMAAGIVEDIVVDLTLEVDSEVGAEELARSLVLPGVEILRSATLTSVWVTVLVAADTEAGAVALVRDSILAQIPQAARVVQAAVVTSAPLGDLHARLDAVEEEPESITLRDLVEAHLWNRREGPDRGRGPGQARRRVS